MLLFFVRTHQFGCTDWIGKHTEKSFTFTITHIPSKRRAPTSSVTLKCIFIAALYQM